MRNRTILWIFTIMFGSMLLMRISFFGFDIYQNLFRQTALTKVSYDASSGETSPVTITSKYGYFFKEDGYKIPIRLSVAFQDSIFQIMGSKHERFNNEVQRMINPDKVTWSSLRWPYNKENLYDSNVGILDTIYRIDTILNNFVALPPIPDSIGRHAYEENYTYEGDKVPIDWVTQFHLEKAPFEISEARLRGSSSIRIFPKTNEQKFVLILRHYLPSLLLIIILYQFFRVVLIIRKNLSFTKNLARRTSYIAIWCLLYAIGLYLIDKEIASWFRAIQKQTSATLSKPLEIVQYYIDPLVKMEYQPLFAGLLLLVLSTLFRRSSEIEVELNSIV